VVERHLRQQIDLLQEHLKGDELDPRFIERHARTIIDLAKDLPVPEPSFRVFSLMSVFEERTA
jgi:hypothetical protein